MAIPVPNIDRLPFLGFARRLLEKEVVALIDMPGDAGRIDYLEPAGDPGLFGPDSVAWRVQRNPATTFIGGVAAVLLELAEPRVRSGVWDHTDFRTDPVGRMRRTGVAALVTTYGSLADVERVTARVRRMHDHVTGSTPDGEPYRASDVELLTWVHVTAAYGFLKAYRRYVDPALARGDQDRYYAESAKAAPYFGASGVPASVAEVERYFEAMRPRLRHHAIVEEFLDLVANAPALSIAGIPAHRLFVEAAIDLLPGWARELLKLDGGQPLRVAMRPLVRSAVTLLGWAIRDGAPQRACQRMGLPASYLSA